MNKCILECENKRFKNYNYCLSHLFYIENLIVIIRYGNYNSLDINWD